MKKEFYAEIKTRNNLEKVQIRKKQNNSSEDFYSIGKRLNVESLIRLDEMRKNLAYYKTG
jgi:hypothetical protein